jgi:ABC-2 type transport system ATP-binding protein
VRVLGLDPVTDRGALVPRIGVMPQDGGVYPGIRVAEALRLFASYYDEPLDPDALVRRVGLEDRARASTRSLSGGERQRLSLALALVGRPQVAFLDEPTAGVDVVGRQVIRQIIRELREDGVAVVLTTHELAEAEHVADRVVIIDGGHVVASGTLAELLRGGDDIRFGAPPGIDVSALSMRLGTRVIEASPGEYVAEGSPTPETVATLTAWLAEHELPLADLRAGRQTLEDVFLRLTDSRKQ